MFEFIVEKPFACFVANVMVVVLDWILFTWHMSSSGIKPRRTLMSNLAIIYYTLAKLVLAS